MNRPSQDLRGYILMEAMIAAALLGVAISANIAVLAQARGDVARGSNRLVAAQHAHAALAEALAAPQTTVATQTFADTPEPGMTTTVAVAQSGLHTSGTPNLADADELHEITVTVTYMWTDVMAKTYTVQALKRNLSSTAGSGGP